MGQTAKLQSSSVEQAVPGRGRSQNKGCARLGPSPGLGLRQTQWEGQTSLTLMCAERGSVKEEEGAVPSASSAHQQQGIATGKRPSCGRTWTEVRPHGRAVSGPGRERQRDEDTDMSKVREGHRTSWFIS